jgi:hypothetical protein
MSSPRNQEPAGTPRNEVASAKKKRSLGWVTPVLALVVAIGVGTFGGVLIGQHTATSSASSSQANGFRGGAGGAAGSGGAAGTGTGGTAGGGVTSGTVVSVNGDSVVLKTSTGSDVTVTTTSSTAVTKSAKSSVSALTAGETVTAIGQAGSSGAITATTISEGTAAPHGFGGGSGSANG